jgi:hypothetical protein
MILLATLFSRNGVRSNFSQVDYTMSKRGLYPPEASGKENTGFFFVNKSGFQTNLAEEVAEKSPVMTQAARKTYGGSARAFR